MSMVWKRRLTDDCAMNKEYHISTMILHHVDLLSYRTPSPGMISKACLMGWKMTPGAVDSLGIVVHGIIDMLLSKRGDGIRTGRHDNNRIIGIKINSTLLGMSNFKI